MTGSTLLTQLLKRAWPALVTAIVAAVLVVAGLAVFAEREYSSTIQIFVKQRYTLTDSYTAAKSAESVSRNLAEVIRTSVFFDRVVAEDTVDFSALLAMDEADRREAWKKTIDTEVISNTAQLRITAYDVDPNKAEAIAEVVASVLIEQGSEWHSSPDTIELKIVDSALTSDRPTRPNFLLNALAAACIGAMAGLLWIFLRSSTSFLFVDRLRHAQQPLPQQPKPRQPQPQPAPAQSFKRLAQAPEEPPYTFPTSPAPVTPVAPKPTPRVQPKPEAVLHRPQQVKPQPEPEQKSGSQKYSVLDISNFHGISSLPKTAPQQVKTIPVQPTPPTTIPKAPTPGSDTQ